MKVATLPAVHMGVATLGVHERSRLLLVSLSSWQAAAQVDPLVIEVTAVPPTLPQRAEA